MNDTSVISHIADICGIISFVVTIILWFRIDRFRQEVEKQRLNYALTQKNILASLIALRANIYDDDLLSLKTISKLREELFAMRIDFGRILSKTDLTYISSTLSMLDIDKINKNHLLPNVDYLIARFRSREV